MAVLPTVPSAVVGCLLLWASACANTSPEAGPGIGSGGASVEGGKTTATGGAAASGGSGSGGSSARGGDIGIGGASTDGGSTNSASGGSSVASASAKGGSSGSGGSGTGGMTGAGGNTATGGATATRGARGSGGAITTGGVMGSGGTMGSGGSRVTTLTSSYKPRVISTTDLGADRMDWSIKNSFSGANHHPIAVVNNDTSRQVLEVSAAAGSTDPDNNTLTHAWFFYKESSSYSGTVTIQQKRLRCLRHGGSPVRCQWQDLSCDSRAARQRLSQPVRLPPCGHYRTVTPSPLDPEGRCYARGHRDVAPDGDRPKRRLQPARFIHQKSLDPATSARGAP